MFLLFALSLLISLAGLATAATANYRIVGGQAIPITMAPYQVSIRDMSVDNSRFGSGFFCGGSLISNSVVLTAAHCLYDEKNKIINANSLQVVGGHENLFVRDANTFVSGVASLKVHESYRAGVDFAHDVAVLKLKTNATITANSTVQLISLPTRSFTAGSSCLITGWGSTYYLSQTVPLLRGANVTVNSASVCNSPNYLNGQVKSGMFCAGPFSGGIDACQGDSGGPLNCNKTIYGITSHGIECATARFPGIYTDVYYYREWILKNGAVPITNGLQMLFVSTILVILTYVRL